MEEKLAKKYRDRISKKPIEEKVSKTPIEERDSFDINPAIPFNDEMESMHWANREFLEYHDAA